MKNYIGISRDHSASMTPIRLPAAKDYNRLIGDIKQASLNNSVDTIVNVVKCGIQTRTESAANVRDVINSSITTLVPLPETAYGYETSGGGTPLFDSVLMLIDDLKKVPDANQADVSFLVMVITDGEDNRSGYTTRDRLIREIQALQSTDRWTFVFRVPKGRAAQTLMGFGIPEGNILTWDQTAKGVEAAGQATTSAVEAYYTGVKSGVRATTRFYTNIDKAQARQVIKTQMKDISSEVMIWSVHNSDPKVIKDFVQSKGNPFVVGTAFYQLIKIEREVQDYKMIVIKDKKAGKVYAGAAARDLLGLPETGTVRVAPGDHAGYDVYIQSTSVNRKLPEGSRLLIWPNAVKVAA